MNDTNQSITAYSKDVTPDDTWMYLKDWIRSKEYWSKQIEALEAVNKGLAQRNTDELLSLKLDKMETQKQLNMLSMLISWMKRKTAWQSICDDYPWLKDYDHGD